MRRGKEEEEDGPVTGRKKERESSDWEGGWCWLGSVNNPYTPPASLTVSDSPIG